MSQDPAPFPLESGPPVPGALDHAWVVESMDQQHALSPDGAAGSLWVARVRCVHCALRVEFRAADVPPCRPQDAPSS